MALRLGAFSAELAAVVSGWARTDEETLMWCGAGSAPVPAAQVNAWACEDGVEQFGLYRDERLVGFGELWVDDEEAEVEVARLIVDPGVRRQGLGRHLAAELASLARPRHPRALNLSGRISRSTGTSASPSFMSGLASPHNACRYSMRGWGRMLLTA